MASPRGATAPKNIWHLNNVCHLRYFVIKCSDLIGLSGTDEPMVVVWRYTRGGGGTRAPPPWSGPGTHVPVLTRRHDT